MLRHTSAASNYRRGTPVKRTPIQRSLGITKDIFQPSNISRTISRFHADLIVNHNTLYHPITTDTVTKKRLDAYHNKLLVI